MKNISAAKENARVQPYRLRNHKIANYGRKGL